MSLEAEEYFIQSLFLVQSLSETHISHICGSTKGVVVDGEREIEHDKPLVPFPLSAIIIKPHE